MKVALVAAFAAILAAAAWLALPRFPKALEPVLRASSMALREGDVQRAVRLAEGAALTKAPEAQFYAGIMNERLKTPDGDVRALDWYRKAADGGHRDACLAIGQAYLSGKGTARDPAQAKGWLKRAAAAGSAPADYSLAKLILAGQLPADDPGEPTRRLEAAAAAGFAPAAKELARLKVNEEIPSGTRP